MVAPLPDPIQRAEQALHDGNMLQARLLLVEFIKTNPRSDRAWWLLSFAVENVSQQIDCLKRVLQLNPAHAEARERLAKLKKTSSLPPLQPAVSPFTVTPESDEPQESKPEPPPALTPTWSPRDEKPAPPLPDLPRFSSPIPPSTPALQPRPSPPAQSPFLEEQDVPEAAPEATPAAAPPRKAKRSWLVADVLMALLVLGVGGFTGYYFWSGQAAKSAALHAQQTQAMAQALTVAPVSTRPPTWTWTPTLLPSATDTLTETPTITLTPENTPTETPIPAGQIGPEVRQFAPDFTLLDSVTGNEVSLSDFKGKPVLLYFWAVNCGYCLAEAADLEAVYQLYKDRGFILMAIDSGDSLSNVNEYRIKQGITFPTLLDPNQAVTNLYLAYNLPVHYFIGTNGRIANIATGRATSSELERLVRLIVKTEPTPTPTP
jgi:peroxiredoxin